MSKFRDGSQMDVQYPDNVVVPTFYSNLLMASALQDDIYLNFCIRDPDRPMVRADLQCRVMTTIESLRSLVEGLGQLLQQHDERVRQLEAQQQG
jgi:hypothetical protein